MSIVWSYSEPNEPFVAYLGQFELRVNATWRGQFYASVTCGGSTLVDGPVVDDPGRAKRDAEELYAPYAAARVTAGGIRTKLMRPPKP